MYKSGSTKGLHVEISESDTRICKEHFAIINITGECLTVGHKCSTLWNLQIHIARNVNVVK